MKIGLLIRHLVISAIGILVILWTCLANAQVVTVSNYPLLLLSNAVTKDLPSAQMLLSAGDVGHHGSLPPDKVKLIKDSRFVVWFGKELEQNLVNSLQDAPNAISLNRFNAFYRLPLRNVDGTPRQDSFDPHFWLDPSNAKAITRALAVIHGHADPANKSRYEQNAQDFAKALDEAVLHTKSEPMPYWAYHDAYQYLERSARLRFFGALTPDHHLSPKATQIKALSQHRPNPTMCLVASTPVSDGILNKLGQTSAIVIQEDFSEYEEFISAWVGAVQKIHACGRS